MTAIRFIAKLFAALCLFAAVVGTAKLQPIGLPSISPSPSTSAAPTLNVSPSASPTPSPLASPTPSPLATPTILMLPPDAPPQILWVEMSSTTPRVGDVMSGVVLASSNVASVEIRVGSFLSINMTKTDVGHFEASYQIPRLPFFVSHNLVMLIIARNTAGVAAETSLPLQIR